jgi:streptomycin 6-kinase
MLHGDFHHENLLLRENGDWAIIDPKGLIGDPAFEVATWLWNPWGVDKWGDYVALTSKRIDIFSDVWGIDRQVLIEWGFFGAVLSACWYGHSPAPEEGRDGVLLTARACEALL